MSCMNFQALNNMATMEDSKEKIVEAGALPLYVKLLGDKFDKSIREEAADGLWTLAFECKDNIINESECLEGLH